MLRFTALFLVSCLISNFTSAMDASALQVSQVQALKDFISSSTQYSDEICGIAATKVYNKIVQEENGEGKMKLMLLALKTRNPNNEVANHIKETILLIAACEDCK